MGRCMFLASPVAAGPPKKAIVKDTWEGKNNEWKGRAKVAPATSGKQKQTDEKVTGNDTRYVGRL